MILKSLGHRHRSIFYRKDFSLVPKNEWEEAPFWERKIVWWFSFRDCQDFIPFIATNSINPPQNKQQSLSYFFYLSLASLLPDPYWRQKLIPSLWFRSFLYPLVIMVLLSPLTKKTSSVVGKKRSFPFLSFFERWQMFPLQCFQAFDWWMERRQEESSKSLSFGAAWSHSLSNLPELRCSCCECSGSHCISFSVQA